MSITNTMRIVKMSLPVLTLCFAVYGCGSDKGGKGGGGKAPSADQTDESNGGKKPGKPGKGKPDGGEQPAADGGEQPAADGGEPGDKPIDQIQKLTTTVGVKNFRQISATMSALTGVPESDATITTEFNKLATALPDANEMRAFNGSHQVAIGKLAVEYCDRMVETPALATALFPGIDLTAVPATALVDANRAKIAKALVDKFWGMGLADMPAEAETLAALDNLFDELLKENTAGTANLSKGAVKGVCSAVLASGQVIFQ